MEVLPFARGQLLGAGSGSRETFSAFLLLSPALCLTHNAVLSLWAGPSGHGLSWAEAWPGAAPFPASSSVGQGAVQDDLLSQLGVTCTAGGLWGADRSSQPGSGLQGVWPSPPTSGGAWRQEKRAEVLVKEWGPERELRARSGGTAVPLVH